MPNPKNSEPHAHRLIDFLSNAFWLKTQRIGIPDQIIHSWQELVGTAARLCKVPAVMIARTGDTSTNILCTNDNPDNPYHTGDRHPLAGTYAEAVIRRQATLFVPDAVKDSHWKAYRDQNFNMTACLGVPIWWPTGSLFGVLSLLDIRANETLIQYQNLVAKLAELVEAQLANRYLTL